VFHDLFDDLLLQKQHKCEAYYTSGRHNNVDCFYLHQNYFKLPRQTIRENKNVLCFFLQDLKNISHIYNDHISSNIATEKFLQLCKKTSSVSCDYLLSGNYNVILEFVNFMINFHLFIQFSLSHSFFKISSYFVICYFCPFLCSIISLFTVVILLFFIFLIFTFLTFISFLFLQLPSSQLLTCCSYCSILSAGPFSLSLSSSSSYSHSYCTSAITVPPDTCSPPFNDSDHAECGGVFYRLRL